MTSDDPMPPDLPGVCVDAITAEQRATYFDQIAELQTRLGDPFLAEVYRAKARKERGEL